MHNDYSIAYEYLTKIYGDNAYLHIVMKENSNKRVKKLVMGVLENHFSIAYFTEKLVDKPVKNNVRPLLFLSVYALKYLLSPVGVVIKETTEALEEIGKIALKNFFVAVLSRAEKEEMTLPPKSDRRHVEVKYNLPAWLVGMYKKDYPDRFEEILFVKECPLTHVVLGKYGTEEDVFAADKNAVKTEVGYFVKNNKEIDLLSFFGKISFMSYGSALIAESVRAKQGTTVLDVCAAPGGKAAFLAKNGAVVTACDVHPHRVELLRSYAERMKVGMDIYVSDATEYISKWKEAFDVVLADVPCSGLGVIGKKRDVVFNRTYEDILALTALQRAILNNVCRYVRKGGVLTYSTCTVFKKENDEIVDAFLRDHPEFTMEKIDLPYENDGKIQFLPDGKGMEGFFVCRMRKA